MDWPALLDIASHIGAQSPDPSRKNGALILVDGAVVASGYNRLPDGVLDSPARWVRPAKYWYVEHAERDAIYLAVRRGAPLVGATLVCPWAACADCARALIGVGISVLVRDPRRLIDYDPYWTAEIRVGDIMLREAGVQIIDV